MTEIKVASDDEMRLIQFFRCLNCSQQGEILETAGRLAIARCKGDWSVCEVMPPPPSCFDEVFDDAKYALGEPAEALLSPSSWLESSPARSFHSRLIYEAKRRGYDFVRDLGWVRNYLRTWSLAVAASCYRVHVQMAKSIAEAESQDLETLAVALDWQAFILTLDGERISKQLDYPEPGDLDVDVRSFYTESEPFICKEPTWLGLAQDVPISDNLSVRLALYGKVRYLQRNDAYPPTEEELEEIIQAITWIATGRGGQ